ncbi:MAG: tRNA preQ1(34) S-adenosylmethionine ribosyltransferase-isomerase QueA [Candidatus Omnitrophica bacterium]|nr:tRNA preQ1(34) S-adenosylmethionine ribosyltransferase-isomerase QueA [Candidatus Omnitrophota bacterium]
MRLSDFDYELPQELIAQYPLKERDSSRMMILERLQKKIYEKQFKGIIEYLDRGDTVVLNDAKVVPARLLGKKETGANIELFLLEKIEEGIYKVLAKPSKRLKIGSKVIFKDGITATVLENADFGKIVKFGGVTNIEKRLKLIGQIPLPPYIKRDAEKLDIERYQTVYAKHNGSTASPTAGLHFTNELLNKIKEKGINIAYVTLNVSYGTFAPVLEEDIERHKMHKEYFNLPKLTADIINETKKKGNKVMAVGTTTTRVLETCSEDNIVIAKDGYTNLFIYPGYRFKIIDSILTNFHLPRSTLLMLVSAFAGREFILNAYKKAIEAKFRFYSYGDCMLVL